MEDSMDQWEIDLRKQLEGGGNSGGTATQPVETIPQPKPRPQQQPRRQPRPQPKPQPQRQSTPMPPKKGQGSSPALLIVTISLLGLLLLAVNTKTNQSLFTWPSWSLPSLNSSPKIEPRREPIVEPEPPVDHSPTISQLVQDVEDLQVKNKTIEERLTVQGRRTAFLGMLHNNNFVVLKNGYDRNDLVFLNRDWTIDQMPKYLNLTPEDTAYLQRYLRRD
jgi:hypothetical protein